MALFVQVNQKVDLSDLIYAIDDHIVGIYPAFVDAIKCVRAQGIKTALLTNNWLKEPGMGHSPVDKSLFDVVSIPSQIQSVIWMI